jgi:hypothetical protein
VGASGGPDPLDATDHRHDELLEPADDPVGRLVGIGVQEIASAAPHQQLERLLELPLVGFEEGRRSHFDQG